MASKSSQLLKHLGNKNRKIKHTGRYALPRKFTPGTQVKFNKNGGFIKGGK